MATNTDAARVVPLVAASLQRLSDADLLAGVRGLVGRSNRLLAELLAHLGDALGSADRPASHDDSAPVRELHEPQLYKVQFTASEEYVRLVEEAKALLSHALPNATLDEIQLRALQAFVAGLKKRKYATTTASTPLAADLRAPALGSAQPKPEPMPPRQRGRHIPAPVRRAVAERDGARCTYLDATGRRCSETHRLEFHHLKPFARGGEHAPANVTLRCSAHNSLAAEDDFGADFVAARKGAAPHAPFGRASEARAARKSGASVAGCAKRAGQARTTGENGGRP
jgi:hypothetical protein